MSDATERKLEWACREIEHLYKEVSMLKNPEFWRLEATRQYCLPAGDPGRTMSEGDIERFLGRISNNAGQPPRIQKWWIPSPKPDKSDPTVIPGFAIARCVINGKEYTKVSCYFPRYVDLYENPVDGDIAKSCVGRKLLDRLCQEGILSTEKSFSNQMGEPRIR